MGLYCSCASRRNIWANRTALQLFKINIQQFIALDYTSPVAGSVSKDDFATFNALNSLVHDEVEVSSLCCSTKVVPPDKSCTECAFCLEVHYDFTGELQFTQTGRLTHTYEVSQDCSRPTTAVPPTT